MAGKNPLTGLPLEPWQTVVNGPGGRQTVVDTRPGAALEPWITRLQIPIGEGMDVTTFVDNGRPGGTYEAQELPELVTTAERLTFPVGLVAGLVTIGGKLLEAGRRAG